MGPAPFAHPVLRRSSRSRAASSVRLALTDPPTHIPIRNGVSPHRSSPEAISSRRRTSQAQIKVGGALELLRGQQAQRVAHQHAHPALAGVPTDLAL